MERTEEGVSELRDRATETIVSATEKTDRTKPGASGAVTGDPALVASESGKERTDWAWLGSTQRRKGKKRPCVEKM